MYHGKCDRLHPATPRPRSVDISRRVPSTTTREGRRRFYSPTPMSASSFYTMPPARMEKPPRPRDDARLHAQVQSRYRLPTWANEGLADSHGRATWSLRRTRDSATGARRASSSERRRPGRHHGPVLPRRLWPDDYSLPRQPHDRPLHDHPQSPEFRAWIEDIKDGRHWCRSMAERFRPVPRQVHLPGRPGAGRSPRADARASRVAAQALTSN